MRGHPLRGEPLDRPWWLTAPEREPLEPEPPPALPRPRTSLPLWGVPCPDGERRLLAVQPTGWVPR